MANELQTLFPVYLARMRKDEAVEDQDAFIAINENNMNQNFNILYNAYAELMVAYETAIARIKALEGK